MKKIFTFIAAVLLAGVAVAGDPPAPPPEKAAPPHGGRFRGPRGGARRRGVNEGAVWQAFPFLNEKERTELLELQRTDPEQFRARLTEKMHAVQEAKRKRHETIKNLAKRYRAADDEKEKAEIKAELTKMVREDFEQRLSRHRRYIEHMRANLEKIEAEFKKREQELDAQVERRTGDILSGKRPERRPPPPPVQLPPPRH